MMASSPARRERRHCLWCGEAYGASHACDRPAGFTTTAFEEPGRRAGSPVHARAYTLTPAGWEQAGYRLVDGRYVKARPG